MRQVKTKPRAKSKAIGEKIKTAIELAFKSQRFVVDVSVEYIPRSPFMRISVVSACFEKINHADRQNIVWKVIQNSLNPNEQFCIASTYTHAPNELIDDQRNK